VAKNNSDKLPPEFDDWLGLAEVARELKIHPITARRLIKGGKIPGAVLFAGKYLIHRNTLTEFKEKGYNPKPGHKPTRRLL